MSEDLKISIIGSLHEAKTTKEIKNQLKEIESKLNVNIGVDRNQLKGLADDIKRLQNEFKKGSQGSTFFDDDALKKSKQYSGQIDDIIKQIRLADKEISSVSSKTLFDPKTGNVKGFNLELQKSTGIVENLRFQLKRLEVEKGIFNDSFVLTDRSQNDKIQVEMQKALSKTLQSRQKEEKKLTEEQAKAINKNIELEKKQSAEIKKQNDELAHRLEMYKQQAALNVKKLQRNYDSSDLDNRVMQGYLSQVNRLTTDTPELKKEMDKLDMSFKNVRESVSAAGSHTLSFSDQLAIAAERTVIWTAATTALFGSIRLLNLWIDQVVLLDDKLTSIKKVADGEIDMTNVLQGNIDAAEEFGRKLDGALESFEKIVALGYSAQDAMKLNENSMLMATVGENLSDEQSAEYLTAIMKQYEMSVEQTSKIVDSFNNLSNKTGATVESLASSLSKSSAAAKVAGIDFDELAAISASLQETLHITGQESGNFLKTLSTRLLRSDNLNLLESLNVQVRDANGELLEGTKILVNLSNAFGSFNKTTQNDVAQALGGVYHINKVNTLLTQMDDILKYTTYSVDSFNSAQNELTTFQEGLTYKINNLILSFQRLAMEASSAGGRDGLVTIIESAENLVTGFSNLIDATDGWVISLSPALGTLTALFLALNGTTRKSIMEQGLLSASLVRTGDSMSIATGKSRILQQQMYNMTLATRAASGAMATLGKVGKSSLAFLGSAFLPIAGMMLLGEAISFLTRKYQEAKKAEEDLKKEQEATIKSYGQQKEKVDSLIESHLKYAEIKNKTKEEEQKHLDIQEQLGTMMPSLISHVDEYGKTHVKVGEALKNELKYAKELVELQKRNVGSDATDKFKKELKARQEATKEAERLRKQIESAENPSYDPKGDRLTPSMFSEDELNKLEMKLRGAERNIANSNLAIRDEVGKLIEEILKLNGIDIDPAIVEQINGIKNSLDVKDMDAESLGLIAQDFSESIGKFQDGIKNATSIGQIQALEQGVKAWAMEMGFTEQQSQSLINTLAKQAKAEDSVSSSTETAKMSLEEFKKAISDSEDDFTSLSRILAQGTKDGYANEAIISAQSDAYKALADEVSPLNELLEKVAEGKQISAAEAMELVAQEEALASAISVENGVIKINEKAVKNLRDAKIKSYGDMLEAIKQEAIQTANKTLANLKNYGIEIQAIQNLADAKNRLAQAEKSNDQFYNNLGRGITGGTYNPSVGVLASVTEQLENIERLQDLASSGLGQVGTEIEKMSESTKKSSKEYENATYISDKFKQKLEEINFELEKLDKIQSKFPDHSKEYQNSLKSEITLLEKKRKLIQDQAKALEAQIKAGKIAETGIVTSKSASYSPASSYASGDSNSAQIWNFFKSKGFTDSIVAGIMGNLQLESGLNPRAINKSSGAFGIAQWLGGRKTALQSFANAMGTSINDLNTQLEFLWNELNSTEKRTLNYLNNNRGASASSIAAAFDKLFERSEGTHVPQRQQYANQFFSQFSGNGSASSSKIASEASKEIAQNLQNIDQAKSELLQLESDILAINAQIEQLRLDLINSNIAGFQNWEQRYQNFLEASESRIWKFNDASAEYRKEIEKQIMLLDNKQKVNNKEINYLISILNQANKLGLSASAVAELQQKLHEARIENNNLASSMNDLNKELDESKWREVTQAIEEYTDAIDDLDHEINMSKGRQSLYDEDSEEYREEIENQIDLTKKRQDEIKKEIAYIQDLMKNEDLSIEKKEELKETLEDLNEEWLSLENQVQDYNDTLNDLIIKTLQKQKDQHLESLEKEMNRVIERKEKDIEATEEYYDKLIEFQQERLDMLDEEIEKEDRLKQLREIDEEIAKVKADQRYSYITEDGQEVLTYNKDQVAELEKQRAEMIKQFEREDMKKAIEDEIDRLRKAKDAKIEIMNQELEDVRKKYEMQIELAEQGWKELIEKVEEGTIAFDELMGGWYGKTIGELVGFGDSVQVEINRIKDLFATMANLQVSAPKVSTGKIPAPPSNGDSGGSSGGWKKVGTLPKYYKFHDGGIVGNEQPNRLTELANKLFNVKPNEQVIKSLKGELQVPPKNIPNLFTNIKNLANSIIPKQPNLVPVGDNITLHIDKVVADNPKQFLSDLDLYIRMNK